MSIESLKNVNEQLVEKYITLSQSARRRLNELDPSALARLDELNLKQPAAQPAPAQPAPAPEPQTESTQNLRRRGFGQHDLSDLTRVMSTE